MPIVLDGIAGITTPEIVSTGGPLVVNASAPDNSVVVDASGNVGIGTSSPAQKVDVVGTQGRIRLDPINVSGACVINFTDVAAANFGVGSLAASELRFNTNGSERARITSAGYFKASFDGTYNGATGQFHEFVGNVPSGYTLRAACKNASPANHYISDFLFTAASPNNTTTFFIECRDSTARKIALRSNGGIANFSGNNVNLSDRLEKTNFAPAKSYLETICAIPVQTFNYIDQNHEEDPGLTLGVVAQDVQEVAPELVMESNWGSKEEPKMRLSVYQTDLQYALMKSIQELKAINDAQAQTIESLTARVVALEQA